MQPFHELTSHLIPLPIEDIDTDQIIPAAFLKVTDKTGLAEGLFSSWRYQDTGKPNPDFPLNRPEYQHAQILLVGDNFGCGSSREHAPWALLGWGIRVVISTSFADIFRNNALKNGLLPVSISKEAFQTLLAQVEANPEAQVTINLKDQSVLLPGGEFISFPIDPFNKSCLLNGVDSLGYLLQHETQISAYENSHAIFG